jgi:hypothetical protein
MDENFFSFFVMQIDNVPVDQNDQHIFVDLPIGISTYARQQDKDQPDKYIENVGAKFFHGGLL